MFLSFFIDNKKVLNKISIYEKLKKTNVVFINKIYVCFFMKTKIKKVIDKNNKK